MSPRREFTRPVQAQIILRATVDGKIFCEGCGVLCKPGQYQIDHTDPDAMQIDKSRKLTAEDGQLLCKAVCHREKTRKDVADIARAKRREAAHLGAKKSTTVPIPGRPFPKRTKEPKASPYAGMPLPRLARMAVKEET